MTPRALNFERFSAASRAFARDAKLFLYFGQENITFSTDDVHIVIGEIAPLLPDNALDPHPASFDWIPVPGSYFFVYFPTPFLISPIVSWTSFEIKETIVLMKAGTNWSKTLAFIFTKFDFQFSCQC